MKFYIYLSTYLLALFAACANAGMTSLTGSIITTRKHNDVEVTYRSVGPEDAQTSDLDVSLVLPYSDPKSTPQQRRRCFYAAIHDVTTIPFIATTGNIVIGHVRCEWRGLQTYEITHMWVNEAHRNRGIGIQLLRSALTYLRDFFLADTAIYNNSPFPDSTNFFLNNDFFCPDEKKNMLVAFLSKVVV